MGREAPGDGPALIHPLTLRTPAVPSGREPSPSARHRERRMQGPGTPKEPGALTSPARRGG
ncbi:hypothetical protein, partial [Streptomyces sp. NPDC058661]|uniref:hypothetical protein n=1 Tax=Streptomyces sp. NPDC058661 TaxID=3346582 RepID=UPI003647F8BA